MGILDEITGSQSATINTPGAFAYGQDVNNKNIQNQLTSAQTANQQNDLQTKQRAMQLSMLSGVLNEPDPDKQRQILGNIVPIANKINPSYQIDPNIDIPTVRALVQSQVTPEEQAKNQILQSMYGMKAVSIEKDPLSGQLVRVNKLTGEKAPLSPQEQLTYQQNPTAFEASQGGGIFPQNNTTQMPQAASSTPAAPAQPAFGFPLSSYANDLPAMRAAQKNTAELEKNKESKAALINDIRSNLSQIEPELQNVKGGNFLSNAVISAGSLVPGGSDENQAADAARTNAQGLALNLSKLQQIGSSGRTTVAALQTLLNSKPDPYAHYQQNNLDNVAHIKGTVENYDAENNFLLAYKDANPMHLVDDNAYKLYDSLQKQFPITTVDKDGHTTFNAQNVQALNNAIPDAIANPQKYMGQQNAVSQANSSLKPQESPKSGTQIVKTQADFDALPSGAIYIESDGKKYKKP